MPHKISQEEGDLLTHAIMLSGMDPCDLKGEECLRYVVNGEYDCGNGKTKAVRLVLMACPPELSKYLDNIERTGQKDN